MKEQWIVRRWYQYKLGSAPFREDPQADKYFDSSSKAEEYIKQADIGSGGDTRYRYTIIPPN